MAAPAHHVPEAERLYRIGDVSRITATKPFVLRFWETEFPMLQPVKAPKGHRLYRQQDIDLIQTIKRLLYEEGFTIPGARRHLAEALAHTDGLAALAQKSPMLVPPAEGTPESSAAGSQLDLLPDRVVASPRVVEPAASPGGARATLLAVRDELRAILTLLGTR
ncbi:MAG TPA: MerR family transcriptional regulator [Candidatus Acidoferrales bacterium]|nr:MerR family transcriptional regulator [Candidatus Acidoferrales bacterium]